MQQLKPIACFARLLERDLKFRDEILFPLRIVCFVYVSTDGGSGSTNLIGYNGFVFRFQVFNKIYDLYGGAGSFSLSCADLCEKSICVESVAPAIYNGIENAKINGVKNVQFFCAKVEDFVKQQPIERKDALIILDPPRGGMHPKACKAAAVVSNLSVEAGAKRVSALTEKISSFVASA